jgi:hypothetical protein
MNTPFSRRNWVSTRLPERGRPTITIGLVMAFD